MAPAPCAAISALRARPTGAARRTVGYVDIGIARYCGSSLPTIRQLIATGGATQLDVHEHRRGQTAEVSDCTLCIPCSTKQRSTAMSGTRALYGAIEAGGTKFLCAVGDHDGRILDTARLQTRDPESTLADVALYFDAAARRFGRLTALGVGSFGPLDLNPKSTTYGFITSTPKPGWQNTDLVGLLRRRLGCPVVLDTDVNGAAMGEWRWGTGRNLNSIAYVTVGTGIGVGVVHHGKPVHGLMHPELGHMRVHRHPADLEFVGLCPFHGDCLEGIANGPAIKARTGGELNGAPAADPIWAIEADYLGQLCAHLVLSHSPQKILMGGGVMQPRLYTAVQARMLHWLNDYIKATELSAADYIAAPGLAGEAGIRGALSLAITDSSDQNRTDASASHAGA
jgi:fructokinase